MRLKSFYAKNMTEAMKMVRDALGEDAVIVATREEAGKQSVKVMAAVEQHDDDFHSGSFNHTKNETMDQLSEEQAWLSGRDTEADNEEAVIEQLTDAMIRHSVPEDITDQVLSCATVIGADRPDEALTAAIEHLFSFQPLPVQQADKAVMFVGPPGAGKTLAAAKLAARGVLEGQKVAVISTDTQRAGGFEQLSSLTSIMGVHAQSVEAPDDLTSALEMSMTADLIVIDTAATNPFDTDQMRELAKFIAAGPIDPILVMPAGTDPSESSEMARVYSALGIKSILPTRLDVARRIGGLLSAANSGSLYFSDASKTHKVADGLFPLSPSTLAKQLMPEAFRVGSGQQQQSLGRSALDRTKETV